jgi:hypothetical protein
MKNKVLIYDSTSGYKRFIKINFNNEFDCENFLEYRVREYVNYDEFVAAFFIVNNPMELVDILKIYKKIDLIFLGSPIVQISESLKVLDDMIFLDMQLKRPEMIDFIKYNLRLFVTNKNE